jgi:NADH dehydrogenase [ubiquinone] 1 alpha subcomplex assembly factor 6
VPATTELSYCASELRRVDPDRFLLCLFAPERVREDWFALYAFNHEIAKVREVVSETAIGRIRLQWWREAIDEIVAGTPRRHAVVEALVPGFAAHGWQAEAFHALIDAREADLDGEVPADTASLVAYAHQTTAPLQRLLLQTLGHHEQESASTEAAQAAGAAYALTGLLRAFAFQLQERRVMLPEDRLREAGVEAGRLPDFPNDERIRPVIRELADTAHALLSEARVLRRNVPGRLTPVMLPGVLAGLGLKRLRQAGYNPFDQRHQARLC